MENDILADLPNYMEASLGQISQGWSLHEKKFGVTIACFEDQPVPGVKTLSTLGHSRYILEQRSGRKIRNEILTSVESGVDVDVVAKALFAISEYQIERGISLARGELITPRWKHSDQPIVSTFIVTNPEAVYLELNDIEKSCEPPLVFVYLISLLQSEANLVRKHGWSWMEDKLESQDRNIWDLARTKGVVEDDAT